MIFLVACSLLTIPFSISVVTILFANVHCISVWGEDQTNFLPNVWLDEYSCWFYTTDIPVSSSSHIHAFYYWSIKHKANSFFSSSLLFTPSAIWGCMHKISLLSAQVSLVSSRESKQYLWLDEVTVRHK